MMAKSIKAALMQLMVIFIPYWLGILLLKLKIKILGYFLTAIYYQIATNPLEPYVDEVNTSINYSMQISALLWLIIITISGYLSFSKSIWWNHIVFLVNAICFWGLFHLVMNLYGYRWIVDTI